MDLSNLSFKKRLKTDYIVIHCSATPEKMNITAKDIDRWHRAKSWLCIGYHYVIRRDGAFEAGRPDYAIGAHVLNSNSNSVGICLVGGTDEKGKAQDNFTPEQYSQLKTLLRTLKKKYPSAKIVGHNFFEKSRGCPSFNWRTWLKKEGF